MDIRKGIVQVYTGNGKGKTTAAWGLALRAIGRGLRVAVVQFLKPGKSGEVLAAERLGSAISVFGRTSPFDPNVNQRESAVLREESRQNWAQAVEIIESGEYDMVILDEMCIVLHYGFVNTEEVLAILNRRPPWVDIILTGRYAPKELVDAADLVTEMVEIKHPGNSRQGIEY
ncbi:MAG: cob(I)yrinic acid a,c-diamide adenosyltransferase [Armatimonadetes bacterium]|nr:cob(I)yrinic acid a,c-diamide adenosyltransferase [Armatimonadota bacterium]